MLQAVADIDFRRCYSFRRCQYKETQIKVIIIVQPHVAGQLSATYLSVYVLVNVNVEHGNKNNTASSSV